MQGTNAEAVSCSDFAAKWYQKGIGPIAIATIIIDWQRWQDDKKNVCILDNNVKSPAYSQPNYSSTYPCSSNVINLLSLTKSTVCEWSWLGAAGWQLAVETLQTKDDLLRKKKKNGEPEDKREDQDSKNRKWSGKT